MDTFPKSGSSLERNAVDKFNCLLYGGAGAGKTPFCGTLEACEKTSPCLFLDVDHGTLSLESLKSKPTVVEINEWKDVQTIYVLLKDKKWDALAQITGTSTPKEYKSLVLDSGTELAAVLLRSIVAEDDRNDGVASQSHYLKVQNRFGTLWRCLRALPMTTVMTAGIRDQKDDVLGIIRFFPEFSPGLLHDLQRMTDLILHMEVSQETQGATKVWKRYLQTQPSQRFVARDRSGRLQTEIAADKIYWKDLIAKGLT